MPAEVDPRSDERLVRPAIDDPAARAALRRLSWRFAIAVAIAVSCVTAYLVALELTDRRLEDFMRNADSVSGLVRNVEAVEGTSYRVTVAYTYRDDARQAVVEMDSSKIHEVGEPIDVAVNRADAGDVHLPGALDEFAEPWWWVELLVATVFFALLAAAVILVALIWMRRVLREFPWRRAAVIEARRSEFVVRDGDGNSSLVALFVWFPVARSVPISVRVAGPEGTSSGHRSVVEVRSLRRSLWRTREVSRLRVASGPQQTRRDRSTGPPP